MSSRVHPGSSAGGLEGLGNAGLEGGIPWVGNSVGGVGCVLGSERGWLYYVYSV